FNRRNRDIGVRVFGIDRAWHFSRGLEFQFGGLAFQGKGVGTALGGGFGPQVRWNFLQIRRWRVFADGGASFILTNSAIPPGGEKYNFFSRAGGGGSFRLTQTCWLEATFRWAHISDGRG